MSFGDWTELYSSSLKLSDGCCGLCAGLPFSQPATRAMRITQDQIRFMVSMGCKVLASDLFRDSQWGGAGRSRGKHRTVRDQPPPPHSDGQYVWAQFTTSS